MEQKKSSSRALTGWLLVIFGLLWGTMVFITDQRRGIDISSTLGGVTVPILVALVGLYFAGVIKNAK